MTSKSDIERIKKLRLIDDIFISKVLEDDYKYGYECVEYIIQTIIENNELKVNDLKLQHHIKNLSGRSVIFDIFATDAKGNKYNIEMQRLTSNKTELLFRARYYGSVIDATSLSTGERHTELPRVYVIFICENDIFGENKPIYHNNRPYCDDSYQIFVNTAYNDGDDDTELEKLIHDMITSEPDEMYNEIFKRRTGCYKYDEKGVSNMGNVMEELRAEGRAEGMAKGREEGQEEVALEMLKDGLDIDKVVMYSKLSAERVKELSKSITA